MQNTVNHELEAAIQVGAEIIHALQSLGPAMENDDNDLTKARAWNNSLMSLRGLLLSELSRKQKLAYPVAK